MRVEGGTSAAAVDVASTASQSRRQQERARHVRLVEVSNRDAAEAPRDDDLLPRNIFMRDLRREKLRADRSSSSLSLVVFTAATLSGDGEACFAELLDVLHARTRETDAVGHLDRDRIAVLCPDTDADGASNLARKIEQVLRSGSWTIECATYPGTVFDELVETRRAAARVQPFVQVDHSRGYAAKRLFDITGALAMLAVLWPLMVLVALAIALTSRGPVIFKQKRLGQGGRPFTFYKFRSMVQDGDDRVHRSYIASYIAEDAKADQGAERGTPYKLRTDPRITRIGRLIRKTSIDELPQLFNVLRGDMSLVGPRPPIPYEAAHYQSWHLRRVTSMKPGLTGLWQVEGRGRVTFNDMVRLDLRYIRDCSLVVDLKILAKTVVVVLRCVGAA